MLTNRKYIKALSEIAERFLSPLNILSIIFAPLYFHIFLKRLDDMLKKFELKKKYTKEDEFQRDLLTYLKQRLFKEIEKGKRGKEVGKRYEDLLYKKRYPIETKINFTYHTRNELPEQIQDYVNNKKHIKRNLSFLEKRLLQICDMHVFVVIAHIKNEKAYKEFRNSGEGSDYGNRVHYYPLRLKSKS